ncbi:glycosyltransferase family 2 protein [Sphingomonas sp. LY160]|uniref:glycosyltransferase family 2 protein n=1 Tax=Sphingomonas sp. LY160 TaxID=3095342 RepID=UPI002ADEA6A0|nr:glycosyltransferase family 2 protein [Sphingomonas sp. LY160]MEA1072005.1 glycosyltransferase family 2 protein [Sphingomonas sp. LY160]
MNFLQAFWMTLRWRPAQALAGLYWHVTRRRVRARNRLREGAAGAPHAYDLWIDTIEQPRSLALKSNSSGEDGPLFSLILPSDADTDAARRIVSVLERQSYPNWELIGPARSLAPLRNKRIRGVDEAGLAQAFQEARGDFVVPLRPGVIPSIDALYHLADGVRRHPKAAILYGDQDVLTAKGRRKQPWFKPAWDREMFLAQDYLIDAFAMKTTLARSSARGGASLTEVLLGAVAASRDDEIAHVPAILSHRDEASAGANDDRLDAVRASIRAAGGTAIDGPFGTIKVDWPLPSDLPAVSIVIPTRDKVELLRPCVESVLAKTDYPNFEVVVVDNGSSDPAALDYLKQIARQPQVRVIEDHRPYNYSAINNAAVAATDSPFVCLLNNDTEVLTPEWLSELMRHASRPDVGAVGAKLLYEDMTIQHAGVVVGVCEAAGHAHRFVPNDEAGYFAQPHITHRVSAVTAACLLVDRAKFDAVGGLDEDGLAVAFNDVDLCLKLERAGWQNIYVPHAVLLHHESKSRGLDTTPAKRSRYMGELSVLQTRWGTKNYRDPRLNPNLDRYSESFILKF